MIDTSEAGRALQAKRKRYERRCPQCGRETIRYGKSKYCSNRCRVAAWRAKNPKRAEAIRVKARETAKERRRAKQT